MGWRVWLSNISHGSSTWTQRRDITYSTAHIVTPRQLEYQLTPLAHDRETRERLSMRDAFCGGVIFTTTNLSYSQKTAMEIIFIPQVFQRLYVSLIHTIRLGWDQIVWCEPKPVHYSGTPHQYLMGSDRVSPFDCWPCQVQCWHGWRSLLSLGQSLCSLHLWSCWKVPAWEPAMIHGSCHIGRK